MRVFGPQLLAALLLIGCVLAPNSPIKAAPASFERPASRPLAFTRNMGQWADSILFRTETEGVTVWFTRTGSYYQLPEARRTQDQDFHGSAIGSPSVRPTLIMARYVGARTDPAVRGVEQLDYKCHFFLGNISERWAVNVPNYAQIRLENIYEGIDLKYYGNQNRLEYDFIISPGADLAQVRIEYAGAESLSLASDGSLVIKTKFGELREQAPLVYQIIANERSEVTARYQLFDNHTFGFDLPEGYDQSHQLIIDPVFGYTSYVGVSGNNEAFGIVVDQAGAAYLTGYTNSADFSVADPLQPGYGGGFSDIVVTKLSPNGQSLEFSTYLGGNGDDKGYALTIDRVGDIYLTGVTTSSDFPTQNAFQASLGGSQDLFISKLAADGSSLEYSTYLGGTGTDVGSAVEVDTAGNLYLTGHTRSTNFPTVNPYQANLSSSNFDAFVTKLASSGSELEYSTFLGGSASDYGRDIQIDMIGNAYIVGDTRSTDFPVKGSYRSNNAGESDLFLAKLNGFGSGLRFSTYFGGSDNDYGTGVAVINGGSAVVTGFTFSTNLPIKRAVQGSHGGGLRDGFIGRFTTVGDALVYSTYWGGTGEEYVNAIVATETGDLFITGTTYSTDFPLVDAVVGDLGERSYDPFLTKLVPVADSTQVEFSSYLGGLGGEIGYAVAVDGNGGVYVAGTTDKSLSAVPPGETQGSTQLFGRADMFVTKFYDVEQCCGLFTAGFSGNANCSADGKRNLADITTLIDRVYITKNELCCEENGNVNGDSDGKLNLADITNLIDHVYISKAETAGCF